MAKTVKKTRRLAPLPLMRNGKYTAKQVLEFVLRLVKEEPKRLNMSDWTLMFKDRVKDPRVKEAPACGTVACLAGWVTIATTGEEAYGSERPLRILGLGDIKQHWLIRSDLETLFFSNLLPRRSAIKRFRELIQKHATELDGIQVEVKRKL
jgi:hypothetical protein